MTCQPNHRRLYFVTIFKFIIFLHHKRELILLSPYGAIGETLVQSLFAYHAGQQSDAAITLANYLINNPSDNSALGYAVKLQKQVHSTRGSRLLECALLFSRGLHIEAVRLCTRLVNDSPDDQAVLRISQVLLKAYSRPIH